MTTPPGPLPAVVQQRLLAALRGLLPPGSPILLVACSGGRDSTVLVDALAAVWPDEALVVAHVHHGLQPDADHWLAACAALAADRGVRFLSRRLDPPDPRVLAADGLEAWARRGRYRALAAMADTIGARHVLTAHHANDQLETVQLRRNRGAGPVGLGAMRVVAPLPGAPTLRLVRPFLATPRAWLADYAAQRGLRWVEDPSNRDPAQPRSRVRRALDEALARDPAALSRGLAAIDVAQREADAIRIRAAADLAGCRLLLSPLPATQGDPGLANLMPAVGAVGATGHPADAPLSRAALARLAPERAAEAIRQWLAEQGLRMPSRAKLAEIVRQLIEAGAAQARVRHDGRWLLRYRDRIDAAAALPEPIEPVAFRWAGETLLEVGGQRLHFRLRPAVATDGAARPRAGHDDPAGLGVGFSHPDADGPGIDADWLRSADLLLDRGRTSDRIRAGGALHHRTLKNLTQGRGLPTWLRPALPVLRSDGRLLYAAPFGTASDAGPADGAGPRILIDWAAPDAWRRWL